MLTGPLGESRIGLSELGLVAGCLLQVEAEDLVQLDEVGAFLLEPVREALVQIGSRRLRQRVVGGVSDQQVAEAEGVFRGNLRRVGADQALPDEGGEARRHIGRLSESAWTAPRWKTSPSIAPRSSTERSSLSSWSSRAARSACRVGGTATSPSVCLGHRHHLGDEQGVSSRGAGDPLAHVARQRLRDQLVDI